MRPTGRFHIRYVVNRLRERLWVKPLALCVMSIFAVFASKTADDTTLGNHLPR